MYATQAQTAGTYTPQSVTPMQHIHDSPGRSYANAALQQNPYENAIGHDMAACKAVEYSSFVSGSHAQQLHNTAVYEPMSAAVVGQVLPASALNACDASSDSSAGLSYSDQRKLSGQTPGASAMAYMQGSGMQESLNDLWLDDFASSAVHVTVGSQVGYYSYHVSIYLDLPGTSCLYDVMLLLVGWTYYFNHHVGPLCWLLYVHHIENSQNLSTTCYVTDPC